MVASFSIIALPVLALAILMLPCRTSATTGGCKLEPWRKHCVSAGEGCETALNQKGKKNAKGRGDQVRSTGLDTEEGRAPWVIGMWVKCRLGAQFWDEGLHAITAASAEDKRERI